MLNVHTGKLQQTLTLCNQTNSQIQVLPYYFYHDGLHHKTQQLISDMEKLQRFLQTSKTAYEQAEEEINDISVDTFQRITQIFQLAKAPVKEPFWTTSSTLWKTSHRFHTSISPSKSWDDYVKNGVCFGAFGAVSYLDLQAVKTMKYARAQGNLSFGNIEGNADLHIQVFDENKNIDPEVNIDVGGKASIGEAKGLLSLGGENIHVDGEVSGKAGVAYGEAKMVINKEEITMKADIGVAALQGDVKGSFSFFGMKVTITGSGEVGALGVGGEFSSKDGELEFGGKFSLLAGLGFKVKLEY